MFSVRSHRGLEAEAVFVSEGFILRLLPNQCFEPTAHQRRWWGPSALRAPAAAQAQR
jgi:hypothetical protein